ncbi:alpha/beta fold hydrolase [Colwellia psychrerythraea]|uniref:Lysophospholipase n=1 Tax=Colwellia psychrerythraea TaxID=28229 RepID=A0A099KL49_COLPS|nr:alpha/beta fold hydrolase [Colwellia psychrerythraea]KGJ91131.1 Lysophospholipase [Colwellia psychrerythraea]
MSQSIQFNQEKKINANLADGTTALWKKGLFDTFSGVNNVKVHYAKFLQEQIAAPTIVIVPGRCEAYLKYQELIFDLYQQGYNIFIIDHRGQGLSERLLTNLNKGYVNKFQHYVDDFQYFIENIVGHSSTTKPYILAHSMGGAIATRFMQDCPNAVKAAVLSSPMFGFNSGLLPKSLAEALVAAKLAVNSIISNTPWYFFGQKDYYPVNFTNNKLTHCPLRYQHFVNVYKQNKSIQLGGVTSHWLAQGIAAQKEIFAKIPQLRTPILLLQAGSDIVVCQQAQVDFCQKLHTIQPQSCPSGVPIVFEGAYHELFFEVDEQRDEAIKQSITWFKQHK